MKIAAFFLMLAGPILPSVTHAQVSIDMARVTCADYLALSPADSAVFSAWMSGWFNQELKSTGQHATEKPNASHRLAPILLHCVHDGV